MADNSAILLNWVVSQQRGVYTIFSHDNISRYIRFQESFWMAIIVCVYIYTPLRYKLREASPSGFFQKHVYTQYTQMVAVCIMCRGREKNPFMRHAIVDSSALYYEDTQLSGNYGKCAFFLKSRIFREEKKRLSLFITRIIPKFLASYLTSNVYLTYIFQIL